MCQKVQCSKCNMPTWRGCGQHIDDCLKDLPEADRCPGYRTGICVGKTTGTTSSGVKKDGEK